MVERWPPRSVSLAAAPARAEGIKVLEQGFAQVSQVMAHNAVRGSVEKAGGGARFLGVSEGHCRARPSRVEVPDSEFGDGVSASSGASGGSHSSLPRALAEQRIWKPSLEDSCRKSLIDTKPAGQPPASAVPRRASSVIVVRQPHVATLGGVVREDLGGTPRGGGASSGPTRRARRVTGSVSA